MGAAAPALLCFPLCAQNLVLNPGFEEHFKDAPEFPEDCNFWNDAGWGSNVSYINDSSIRPGLRPSVKGYLFPRNGQSCMIVTLHWVNMDTHPNNDNRGSLCGELMDTLTRNTYYFVRFYVRLYNFRDSSGLSSIALDFSESRFSGQGYNLPSDSAPDVPNPLTNYLIDTVQWMPISGIYKAKGWEKFIILGNFSGPGEHHHLPINSNNHTLSYFFDDVSVQTLDFGPDRPLCFGETITLKHYFNFDDAVVQWSDGSKGDSLVVSRPGTYWCSVTIDGHTFRDTIEFNGDGWFSFQLPPDTALCEGNQIDIQLPAGPHYTWQDGSTSGNYIIKQTGTYTVQAAQATCADTQSINVYFDDPSGDVLPDSTVFCIDDNTATLRVDVPYGFVAWDDGSTDKERTVYAEGYYGLTLTNTCGTFTDGTWVAFRACDCHAFVPNAFSPNGDGYNPRWFPVLACEATHYSLRVYNRWGTEVFSTGNPAEGWDGRLRGKALPGGTYVYTLRYHTSIPGQPGEIMTGTVELLR